MRDGNESFTVIWHSKKLCSSSNNVIFEAAHHVSEVILEVRIVPGVARTKKIYHEHERKRRMRSGAQKHRIELSVVVFIR